MSADARHAEVLVVGAGPAGLAAATAAANHGCKVLLVDDNPHPGGQIWRTSPDGAQDTSERDAARLRRDRAEWAARAAFRKSGAEFLPGRRVVDAPQRGVLRTIVDQDCAPRMETFAWERLILATGARERFLPFPGWTLPGVFGAGGLQSLVKGGYPIAGKRVVVAGSGPLLLAVAVHLQKYGAKIVSIAEQTELSEVLRFAAGLGSHPGKALQGIRYRAALSGVPYRMGWWPVGVDRSGSELVVRLTNGKSTLSETCDSVAVGFHLVPNTELGELLGCALNDRGIVVNQQQQTTVADVFCVGEPTGVAGLDAALVQGEIAGLAAAGQVQKAAKLYPKCAKERAFGERLSKAFHLRQEVCSLAAPETIVCRCEDVSYARLQKRTSWTEAKLQTRCGMGPCQGRICGPAVQSLFGWRPTSVRPPLFPVPIGIFGNGERDSLLERSTLQETK